MNRQALSSPAALPIGVELRIPPRESEAAPADDVATEEVGTDKVREPRLVPVVD